MKKSWWNSLRVKIIAWSFVPTVIILSAVAWFTFYSYQKVIGDLAVKQDLEFVQLKMDQFVDRFNRLIEPVLVPIIMEVDVDRDLSPEARAQNILDQAQGLEIFDGGIYFLDQQGKVIKTKPEQPEILGQDWSDNPQFRHVREHPNQAGVTDLLTIGTSKMKVICSVGALADMKWKEIVGAGYYCFKISPFTQNTYYQAISSLDLGPNLLVLDRNQQIVYSSNASEMGTDRSGEAYLQQLFQEQNQSGRFQSGNEDVVVSYVPISSEPDAVGWIVLNEQSWDEIMQPTSAYQRLLLVLLALGVVVPVLVTAYGVRHITNPIQKLILAAEQVTAGEFKQRIEVKTGDEIEILADQFNLMSEELDESYTSLEKRVADRTRELAIINTIISVASQSLDVHEILEDVLDQTVQQMGFEAGAAFRLEANPTKTSLVGQLGFEPNMVIDLVESNVVTGQGKPVVFPKEVVVCGIEDCQEAELKELFLQSGFQQLVYVPLSTKGRELGFFILGKHEASQLLPEELSLLSSISKQTGVAVENARLYEQAEQSAVVAERTRLARELHDAVTQTLFSASLIADVIPRIWERNPEEGLQNLEELRQLTRGALAEMRTLLLEMRPESLQRSDIRHLFTQLADAFIGRVRIPLDLQIHGDCGLTHEVKVVFYRVAQEALNNIAKHSGARQVDLHLECQPGQLSLVIKDDGLGFEDGAISPDHMGIAIMRERANSIGASLKIESQLGQGTTVELNWLPARKDGINDYVSDDPGHVS